MGRSFLVLFAVLSVLCLAPAITQAATVTAPTTLPPNIPQIIYTAANGESNNLTITSSNEFTVFTDTGAPVTAGVNCTQVTASSVRCLQPTSEEIIVNTGDGADQVTDQTVRHTSHTASQSHYFNLGVGNDTLNSNTGHNDVNAGDGNDTVHGGEAYDFIRGGDGNDTLNGNGGQDTMEDLLGTNTINGGDAGDYLRGGDDVDTITGGLGADEIYSDDSADIIFAADSIIDALWCITGDTVTKDANDTIRACGP